MVAHNTIPHLFADRNADAVLVLPAFYHIHNQQTVPVRGSIFINILELPVAFKRWKSFTRLQSRKGHILLWPMFST